MLKTKKPPARYRLVSVVDEALYREVEEAADVRYLSLAAFVRLAVLAYLRDRGNPDDLRR